MYNRTLKRPMFRIGGSAGTGITTGLPRQGYKGTDDAGDQRVKQMQGEYEFLKEQVGERPQVEKYPYKASDFFMNLGSNILAQPGGEPIFQTLGKASIQPLERLTKTNIMDFQTEQEGKLSQYSDDRDLLLTAYKNTSEGEKNKLWQEANAMFDNKGVNPETKKTFMSAQEAYNLLLKNKFMSKERILTPEAQYNNSYNDFLSKHLSNMNF